MSTAPLERSGNTNGTKNLVRSIFNTVGILPLLLAIVILYFASQEPRFYGGANVANVFRQATYLVIVTLGQALVLISGGFDLFGGAVLAGTRAVSARFLSHYFGPHPARGVMSLLVGGRPRVV